MYLRNVKQFIKNATPTFDEHRYGFHSFLEAVRHAQRAGLLRLERNRQGILRVFPGNALSQLQRSSLPRDNEYRPLTEEPPIVPYDVENDQPPIQESEPEAVLAAPVEEATESQPESVEVAAESVAGGNTEEEPVRKRRSSSGIKRKTVAPRKSAGTTAKRPRKKASPPPEEGSI
jgi:hypothetical protein